MQEINRNIDAAADIDSPYFWRLFNSKRKNNSKNVSNEIKFDDVTFRNQNKPMSRVGKAFCTYSDTECASYDSRHYDKILDVIQKIKEKPLVADNDHISENEVAKLCVHFENWQNVWCA